MKLISRITCPDGIDDCDYALIDLTPALAQFALKRVATLNELNRTDTDLFEMYFWDYHAEYFSPWLVQDAGEGDRLAEMIEALPAASADLLRAPGDFEIPENLSARVECAQMIARDDAISFVAIPKHTDIYVHTAEIRLALLHEAANFGLPVNSTPAPGV